MAGRSIGGERNVCDSHYLPAGHTCHVTLPSGLETSGNDVSPADLPTMWRRVFGYQRWIYPITFVGGMSFVVGWFVFRNWSSNGLLPIGGDYLWVQSSFESIKHNGFLSADPHLNWPHGLSIWTHPQLGTLIPFCAWIFTRIIGIQSGIATFWTLAFNAGTNAVAALYFFRGVTRRHPPLLGMACAVIIGAGPFTLVKIAHLNVSAWFFIPLLLGAAARIANSSRRTHVLLSALVGFGALASPMWWIVVGLFVLGISIIPWLAMGGFREVRSMLGLAFAATGGMGVQILIIRQASLPDQLPTRGPWDSNLYGGHLTDLLLSSTWLNSVASQLDRLWPGTSVEMSPVGLVGGLAGMVCVVMVLASILRPRPSVETSHLTVFSLSTLLFFLAGGFGGVQAALALYVSSGSPARVWARLTILLALLGSAWILTLTEGAIARYPKLLRSGNFRIALIGITAVMLGTATADAKYVKPNLPEPLVDQPEYGAIQFLRDRTDPCPVAQLPLDSTPAPRVPYAGPQSFKTYLRPFAPYIMAPEYFWSFGPYQTSRTDGLNSLPMTINTRVLDDIADLGFCAVLFDTALSLAADAAMVELQGQYLAEMDTDYRDSRYVVILLNE